MRQSSFGTTFLIGTGAFVLTVLGGLAAPGDARANYCHAIGYVCPTGATEYCSDEPIDPYDSDQAKEACEACYGTECQTNTYDTCRGGAWGPPSLPCFSGFFGYQDGQGFCAGAAYAGVVWKTCSNDYFSFGHWAPPQHCVNGSQDGDESGLDCGGADCGACCGDGVVDPLEECDDGNGDAGDGCASCNVEECYECSGSPSSCSAQPGASCAGDGDPCTLEVCDGAATCTHPAGNDGSACADDGDVCTLDQCSAGSCTHPAGNDGAACPGDGNDCTLDVCAAGTCDHPGDVGAACPDDGNDCTLDQCDAGGGCAHPGNTGAACPDDGNDCTFDQCDAGGGCAHPGNTGASCADDGDGCTLDQCDAGGDCVHPANTGAACADDGNECTDDQCDASGACAHPSVTDGLACDDSSVCTENDECVAGTCTGDTAIVCCNGICNADTGACDQCPPGYDPYSSYGCTKRYDVSFADLDNVESQCSATEVVSTSGIGFHLTDPGDTRVGQLLDVAVDINSSQATSLPMQVPVTLNGGSIGSYFANPTGACGSPPSPQHLSNFNAGFYHKDSINYVVADWTGNTHGLAANTDGYYGSITVTYAASSTIWLANGTPCDDGNPCSLGDHCGAGDCTPDAAVVCTPSDACHAAGTCDYLTGECSNPSASDGTSCDDGNPCTLTDSCQAGTCVGSNEMACPADQCSIAGTCQPTTGLCSSSQPKPSGSACNDGSACTQLDTCQAGTCLGSNPVICGGAPDQCHQAGTCNAFTGSCEYADAADYTACDDSVQCTDNDQCIAGVCYGKARLDGAACDDGSLCTDGDTCQSNVCQPGTPVTCESSDACHTASACAPLTGCSETLLDCDDGSACTTDSCNSSTGCQYATVVCEASDACHVAGTCNPASGCSETALVCNDNSPCTSDDCDPDSGCVFDAAIRGDCRSAGSSVLGYSNNDDDAKDKLKWKWGPGPSTSLVDLGVPSVDTDYQLCVFSTASGASSSVLDAVVPASSMLWSAAGTIGYKYTDIGGSADGMTKALLKSSDAGKTKIGFGGAGANLGDAALPLPSGLTSLQVQLTNLSNNLCWDAQYPAASVVEKDGKFSAKIKAP